MKKLILYSIFFTLLIGYDIHAQSIIEDDLENSSMTELSDDYTEMEYQIELTSACEIRKIRRDYLRGRHYTRAEANPEAFHLETPQSFRHISLTPSTSANWSGYAVRMTPNTVSAVSGNWVVPALKSTPDNSYTALWVGIDGYNSNTVEQIGTAHNWINGKPQHYAWFEMYPGGAYQIVNFPVNPGDVIYGSVVYKTNNIFQLVITNQTRRVSYTIPSSYTILAGAQRSSAEWIAEAPTIANTSIAHLSNFQSVTFSNCSTTIGGITGPITTTRWQGIPITMVSPGNPAAIRAVPSNLNSAKNGFSVVWKSE